MANNVIRVSEAEASRDFAGLLARVRAGMEVIIENGLVPIAVISAPHILSPAVGRRISECISLLPEDSTAVMDAEFAADIEAGIQSHREPLSPPSWD